MKNTNIAIFERNEKFLGALCEYFEKTDGFTVCATALSGDAALEALKVNKPDVAIIDTALKGIDGIKLLDHIKSMYPACLTFMMSEFDNDKIVNSAINHGAIYYFIKPVTPQVIGERVADLLNEKVTDYKVSTEFRDKRRTTSLDEKISNIFTTIGIPPHIKGYVYMREGIKMAVECPSIINKVTKELYPQIFYNVKQSRKSNKTRNRGCLEQRQNGSYQFGFRRKSVHRQ